MIRIEIAPSRPSTYRATHLWVATRVDTNETLGRDYNRQDLISRTRTNARELATVTGQTVTLVVMKRDGRTVAAEWSYGPSRRGGRSVRPTVAQAAVTGRRFGIELEFRSCRGGNEELARAMRRRGINCEVEHYNHQTRSHWKIVTDSSCGYELVSPPLSGAEGLRQVMEACEALREVDARQDTACGLHVHVEATDLTLQSAERILRSYLNSHNVLDRLFTSSRQNNSMCRQLTAARVDNVRNYSTLSDLSASWDRYQTVNLACFARQGTVEFRQHNATRRGQNITDWITLVIAIVEFAQAGGVMPLGLTADAFYAMVGAYGVDADARSRLAARTPRSA